MRLFLIILLILSFVACNQSKKYAIRTELDVDILSIDSIEVSSNLQPPIYEYWIDNDFYKYDISFQEFKGCELFINNTDMLIRFVDSASVMLDNEELTLYKFIVNEHIIDGASVHYFSNNHGLILIKSRTWHAQTEFFPWANAILDHTNLMHEHIPEFEEFEIDSLLESQIEEELKIDGS